jgi:DNA-directed RNA polymerase subunit H (RpoH/RPB5)
MDLEQLVNKENKTVFHPSIFQISSNDKPLDDRTLQSITKQRGQRLTSETVEKMISPGSFNFTIDDKKVSGSNTRFLFKNLYGETPLTFLFFSDKNIQNIQNILRYNVYKQMKYTIDNQSTNELMIIMRSLFLEYSAHPKLLDESMSEDEKRKLLEKYTIEVARLNKIVVDSTLPKVISQIQQYVDYLRDSSKQPYYMDKPKNESVQGMKQYRSATQVLLGGKF